jgi:hypothetical protein
MAGSPNSTAEERRVMWAFWIACGLAAVGGVAPFLLGGGANRISGVVFPFGLAAIALGACAFFYQQGKPVATALYFVASLAIVYGILYMVAVPLRLAVVGTCPPDPASCLLGYERPLTGGESTSLGFSAGMGIVAVLTGFFGLTVLYHHHPVVPPVTPPPSRIAPVAKNSTPEDATQPEASTDELETDAAASASAEPLELPAPATVEAVSAAPPPTGAQLKARQRRPKAPPDSWTAPNIDPNLD